jgi:hypothetical protein
MEMEKEAGQSTSQWGPQGGGILPAPPEAAPHRGHTLRNVLIAIGILVLLMLVAVGFVGATAVATGDRLSAAGAAIDKVDHDATGDEFAKAFADVGNISSTASAAEMAREKAKFEAAAVTFSNWITTMRADKDQLAAADRKVQDRSFLTALSGGTLDKQHRRLQGAQKAVDVELQGGGVVLQQMRIVTDFIDAMGSFVTMGERTDKNDIKGALAAYGPAAAGMSKVKAGIAAAPETPAEFARAVDLLQTTLRDMRAVLDAVDVSDLPALDRAQAALKVDLEKLDKLDGKAIEKQYLDLGKKYDDRANAILKAANRD